MKKVLILIAVLAIVFFVFGYLVLEYLMFHTIFHPHTLIFDIFNEDNVRHNVTVKIFKGKNVVFEGRYTVNPMLSVYKDTGLTWGEYVIELNLDGKVYRYKAKVKPGYIFLVGGFTLISFKIKNSTLNPKIEAEGPPYIEFVEFADRIFEKKFLFLEVCRIPLQPSELNGTPNYRFDEKRGVIYVNTTPPKVNDSLKAVVGVGVKRCVSLCPTLSSRLEPIYSLPYTVDVNGSKVEILEINEYGTVKLRFNDDRVISLQRGDMWLEESKNGYILVINHGFLNKSKEAFRFVRTIDDSSFLFIEAFGIPVPREKLKEMGCRPLWADYVDFPVYSFDEKRRLIKPEIAPKDYFDRIDFGRLRVLVGAGVIGYVSGVSSKLVPIYEFPSEFRVAGMVIEVIGLDKNGNVTLVFKNETTVLPPNSTFSVKIRECGEKIVFYNHGFLDKAKNEHELK